MDELQARVAQLEKELITTQRERDDENRQKRQLHLVYMMTVEQLAEALGFTTIEGQSTQDFVDRVKALRLASTEMVAAYESMREMQQNPTFKGDWRVFVGRANTAKERLNAVLQVPATAPADAAEGAE